MKKKETFILPVNMIRHYQLIIFLKNLFLSRLLELRQPVEGLARSEVTLRIQQPSWGQSSHIYLHPPFLTALNSVQWSRLW